MESKVGSQEQMEKKTVGKEEMEEDDTTPKIPRDEKKRKTKMGKKE